tara:strand:+ start:264 stop:578 length:315 start_codon:yes stop_codon:yes gene_type:complete
MPKMYYHYSLVTKQGNGYYYLAKDQQTWIHELQSKSLRGAWPGLEADLLLVCNRIVLKRRGHPNDVIRVLDDATEKSAARRRIRGKKSAPKSPQLTLFADREAV